MTGLFFVLAMLSMLVISVTGIWLLVLAFRASTGWGLAVLLLPFAVVVFAIKFWDECKKPFLAHLGGAVATVLFIVLAVMSGVSGEIAEAMAAQTALGESAPSASALSVSEPSTDSTRVAVEPAPKPSPRPKRVTPVPAPNPTHASLTFSNASKFVGKIIKVTAHDGRVLKGYLIDARRDRLVLEKELSSGVFSFEITQRDVKTMEVVR